jgi:nucleoside-diphosphate-sugar epimerase
MNILLTGGLGYLGTVLTPVLLNASHKVRILDCALFGTEFASPFIDNIELQRGDIRNSNDLLKAMENIDVIIHLAAVVVTGNKETAKFKRICTEINEEATKLLIDLCNKSGKHIRLIFPSSCSLYGHSKEPVDETSHLDLTSIYAFSKAMAEEYIMQATSDKIDYTILRLSTLFGNSPRMRFDLLVNELTRDACCGNKITLKNPQALRPNLHVEDAAQIITNIINCRNSFGQIINVGCEANTLSKENLAHILQHIKPKLEVVIEEDNLDIRNYAPSFKKLQNTLPVEFTSVYHGIEKMVQAIEHKVYKDMYGIKSNNREFYNEMFGD